MAKYDFEEEVSGSDSDNDELLRHEVAALSTACFPSAASSSSSSDDDLELVRSIKEQYGGTDISKPLSLDPLTSLPPITSDDDEDDFETLRAIQRRFSYYNGDGGGNVPETKNDTCGGRPLSDDAVDMSLGNESLDVGRNDAEQVLSDAAENPEATSYSSSFPKVAQSFTEAIKKNRSCQKFIRSKLLHIEARMEKIKELHKRVKTLREFQVHCRKKIGRALSQKQDARIELIKVPKQRANAEDAEKKVSAMGYGPLENSHVTCLKTTLAKFPLSFHRENWSKAERENLEKGIIQQFQETLVDSAFQDPGYADGLDRIISSISHVEITPEIIQGFAEKVNWEQLASRYCLRRSGAECESRWLNYEDRLINRDNWTPVEDKQLLLLIQQNGINNWSYVTEKLKTHRTPFQCLARYQRSLNASILKRDWSEDEDAQLRSAVELFGESNWQAVASVLEGRRGTQCSNRWKKTLHPTRQRVGRWNDDEDKRLRVAVTLFGQKNWYKIAQFVPGRTQVQCRERWVNVLDPFLIRGAWTTEEDLKLKEALKEHGYFWSKVAACVPMRTDNQCRRRWMRLFPHEVPLLQAGRNIQKVALITNFVDRESERPALGPNDFVPLPIEGSSNELENDYIWPKHKKSRRRAQSYPDGGTTSCSSDKTIRRRLRKRARSPETEMSRDGGDAVNSGEDKFVKDMKKLIRKFGSKKKKCNGNVNIATELKKNSKSKESETREVETWGIPVKIRSRRPRGVKSKAIPLISDHSVSRDTDFDGANMSTAACMSCSGENNDYRVLQDQSTCSGLPFNISEDEEVEPSNINDMARKQNSSKLQKEMSLTAPTRGANSCVTLETRTSSSDSTKIHYIDADGSSKRNFSKKNKKSKLPHDQAKEWESLPLAVLFSEAVTCLQRRKSSLVQRFQAGH